MEKIRQPVRSDESHCGRPAYWEKRRLLFNLFSLPLGLAVYVLRSHVSDAIGDVQYLKDGHILFIFVLVVLGLNVYYCIVYFLDKIISMTGWNFGRECIVRRIIFGATTIIGTIVFIIIAREIAGLKYTPSVWTSH